MNIAAFFELPTGKRALNISRGEADEETEVVGLYLCLMGGAIAAKLTAFGALVDDDKAFSRIGLHAQGHHFSTAFRGAVAGIDVQMERPQAEGAMISGAIA